MRILVGPARRGLKTAAVVTVGALLSLSLPAFEADAAMPAFVQVNSAVPQSPQSTVATTFTKAQVAGDLNAVVVGWNEAAGNVTSVTDSAGNPYQVAAATTRGTRLSQAVYYAKGIAAAGANTVTVRFDKAVAYADVRILESGGLDATSPLDVTRSAAGSTSTASSDAATTQFATELLLGAGTTDASFTAPGTGYTSRIITNPDADIAEDRTVSATGSYSATAPFSAGAATGSCSWSRSRPPDSSPAASTGKGCCGSCPTIRALLGTSAVATKAAYLRKLDSLAPLTYAIVTAFAGLSTSRDSS
jgi:hypothetical protein